MFENLSIELLSLLTIFSQKNPLLKIKRSESLKINNDLESKFQLNLVSDKTKLSTSTLSILLSNNPRYEGYYLNLNLRQRFLKGNFKCFIIGSFIDLTFPTLFLGSNTFILKNIIEGNHLICQDLKEAKNPILISNYELLKRNDGKNIIEMLTILKYANLFTKVWNGLNILSPALSEVGTQTINNVLPLTEKDLNNFSSLYFLNVSINNITTFKKITELKLLKYYNDFNNFNSVNHFFIDQGNKIQSNFKCYRDLLKTNNNQYYLNYINLPSSMFYENEETFINTEGFIKRTTKLIFQKKTRNNWQLLRKIFNYLKTNLVFLNSKNNNFIIFNYKNFSKFKNYINFQYQATQTLTNINFYLSIRNQSFLIYNKNNNFRQVTKKIKTSSQYKDFKNI